MKNYIIYISLLSLIAIGCSSRKVETNKKVEELSEITQNDIKTEKSEILETKTISNIQEKTVKATSIDPDKDSSLNITGNTVSWKNASIDISDKKEDVSNTTTGKATTKTKDKSKSSKDATVKDKGKSTERESPSWGLNAAIIIGVILLLIMGYVHYRTTK